jgi:hypothetical protein
MRALKLRPGTVDVKTSLPRSSTTHIYAETSLRALGDMLHPGLGGMR